MLAFSEILRPTELADLIQGPSVIGPLTQMIERKSLQNLLFHGSPGLGKTSAAHILLTGTGADKLVLNGALSAGIDLVRTKIDRFCTAASRCNCFQAFQTVSADGSSSAGIVFTCSRMVVHSLLSLRSA